MPNEVTLTTTPVSIELRVSTSDGAFDSRLVLPITATKEQLEAVTGSWLEMMRQALRISQEKAKEVTP